MADYVIKWTLSFKFHSLGQHCIVEHILCVEGTTKELSFVRGLEHYDPVADHKFIKLYRKLPGPGKERMVERI